MRRITTVSIAVIVFLACYLTSPAQERITPADAANYVGKNVTVCGKVASATYAARSKGRPTFLNLDRPYPNQIFTALIWGESRGKFSTPPDKAYSGKQICVTGVISTYRNQPQIVVKEPSQISTAQ